MVSVKDYNVAGHGVFKTVFINDEILLCQVIKDCVVHAGFVEVLCLADIRLSAYPKSLLQMQTFHFKKEVEDSPSSDNEIRTCRYFLKYNN